MINQIVISAVTGFTPILIMMLVDLVTGVAKSLQKHSIKSAKLRNSLNKCVIYFVVLLIGGCLAVAGEDAISTIFVIFLALIEGVSILENLQELFPKIKVISKLAKFLESKVENKIENGDK